ncbi:MAG: histidinol dehydrogenase [Actinomycetota bacterium]
MEHLKRVDEPSLEESRKLASSVTEVLDDIRANGEEAVRRYSERFDDWLPRGFAVSDGEIAAAKDGVPEDVKESLRFAQDRVREFAQAQRATLTDLEIESRPGVVLGHRHIPVAAVGAYVPGGRYTLIASAYNSIIPAKVAGVERVVVCMPPSQGRVSPVQLYSAALAGADRIYALGGIQAIGAMAYGALEGLEPVDMVVGPGNQFVTEAKRQVFGMVGLDLLAGPTEICILADDDADPYIVAADLVGQAEHDPDSRAILITTSRQLARSVLAQIGDHIDAVKTADIVRQCWENGGEVIVVDDVAEMMSVCDDYAIEHVEVLTRDPESFISRLRNYGSLFVGEETTVAYGDKVSGPNHILPTLRAARFTGGLWVGKFLKTATYQHMTRKASLEMAPHCENVSIAEGMVAHARTAAIRRERYRGTR